MNKEKQPVIELKKTEFLCYLYSDADELRELGEAVLKKLINGESFDLSDVENQIGTVPYSLILNTEELNIDMNDEEYDYIEDMSGFTIEWK